MKKILSIYALLGLGFIYNIVGLWILDTFATTTAFAQMHLYDAVVCMVSLIFIIFGLLVVGKVIFNK